MGNLTRMLRNLSVPKKNNELGVTLSPLAHAMFHSMYVTRKVFMMLDETVDDSRVDEATVQVAWIVIDEKAAKYEKYHRLWRKWLVLWTTVSRWTTATGEGSGSIERPVGEAAVAAEAMRTAATPPMPPGCTRFSICFFIGNAS